MMFQRVGSRAESLLMELENEQEKGKTCSGLEILVKFEEVKEKAEEAKINISKIVNLCWDSKGISSQATEMFKDHIKNRQGRASFIEAINEYRAKGLFTLTPSAFNYIAKLFYFLLNQLMKDEDTECLSKVIIYSQTYFNEQKKPSGKIEKCFLQEALQTHQIWKEESTWSLLLKSSLNELSPSSEGRDEMDEANELAKFITYFSLMYQFSVPEKIISDVTQEFIKTSQSDPKKVTQMIQNLKAEAQTLKAPAPPSAELMKWISEVNIQEKLSSSLSEKQHEKLNERLTFSDLTLETSLSMSKTPSSKKQ